MKKYISLFSMLSILVVPVCTQNTNQSKGTTTYPCIVDGFDFGTYYDEYRVLNKDSFDTITMNLNKVLNCKDIQVCRENNLALDAWFTLMRIQDIEWGSRKTKILNYLKSWLKQILSGNSFLNENNKNILKDKDGCPYTNGDPISLPYACYAVAIKLDTKYATNMLSETWELLTKDELFENRLRISIFNLLDIYYKNPHVQLLLEKLEKTNISKYEIQKVQEIRLKYELIIAKNQKEAWKKIISRSYNQSSGYFWIDNNDRLIEIFGNVDINIPLELAEQEKDVKTKYWLIYSACFLINKKYPTKSDKSIIRRIDELVDSIRNEKLDFIKGAVIQDNYLNDAYKALKTWH